MLPHKCSFFTRILYLLYTLPAPKQALTQNLGQAFTYFSRNSQIQRKNCAISAGSGLSTVTVRRVVSSTGASMQMPSSSVSQRHSERLAGAVEGLPSDAGPAPAVEVIPGQRVADGSKMHPDLMGAARHRHAGREAEAVFCL